ncbi:hypothetical protein GW17_00012577 [Ensete ventricosum]|nr:hypothetical protein GW17_00012577 [Ensete ventricosum]
MGESFFIYAPISRGTTPLPPSLPCSARHPAVVVAGSLAPPPFVQVWKVSSPPSASLQVPSGGARRRHARSTLLSRIFELRPRSLFPRLEALVDKGAAFAAAVCQHTWEDGDLRRLDRFEGTEEWWRGWSDTYAGRAEHSDGQIEAVADRNQKFPATERDRGRRGCSCRVRSTGHKQDAGAQQGHPAREGEQQPVTVAKVNTSASCRRVKPQRTPQDQLEEEEVGRRSNPTTESRGPICNEATQPMRQKATV